MYVHDPAIINMEWMRNKLIEISTTLALDIKEYLTKLNRGMKTITDTFVNIVGRLIGEVVDVS